MTLQKALAKHLRERGWTYIRPAKPVTHNGITWRGYNTIPIYKFEYADREIVLNEEEITIDDKEYEYADPKIFDIINNIDKASTPDKE